MDVTVSAPASAPTDHLMIINRCVGMLPSWIPINLGSDLDQSQKHYSDKGHLIVRSFRSHRMVVPWCMIHNVWGRGGLGGWGSSRCSRTPTLTEHQGFHLQMLHNVYILLKLGDLVFLRIQCINGSVITGIENGPEEHSFRLLQGIFCFGTLF